MCGALTVLPSSFCNWKTTKDIFGGGRSSEEGEEKEVSLQTDDDVGTDVIGADAIW